MLIFRNNENVREHFRDFEILSGFSLYYIYILIFIENSIDRFITHKYNYTYKIKYISNLGQPYNNLELF